MKRKNVLFTTIALILALLTLASCSSSGITDSNFAPGEMPNGAMPEGEENIDIEEDGLIKENPFISTEEEPISTFSADVDTASYTYMRKLLKAGYSFKELSATAGGSLRTEELVNYFDYACPAPEEGKLFGYKAQIAPTPWNGATSLLMLTLKTKEAISHSQNNLVFLIDVSGSMASKDKLPLLKKAFAHLVDKLDEDDRVSIVTYSGSEAVVLEGCMGSKKEMILDAINSLKASGATNGEAGLQMAYQLAEKHFIEGGNNRIFMASDGDLNVGISSKTELEEYIATKRDAGVFLSVLGFGTGNYKDSNMEALADNGNGVYYYIDGEEEAEKIFGEDIFSSLYTVAKDVKLQLSFNPEIVSEYRLIGYENRLLSNEDFLDDTKDAGELGAGHSVTVLYELRTTRSLETLPFATLGVRYKTPDESKSTEEFFVVDGDSYTLAPDGDFRFAAAVAEWSLLLRSSRYKGQATLTHLDALLSELDTATPDRAQFITLIRPLLSDKTT